jgi:hypothetical protein
MTRKLPLAAIAIALAVTPIAWGQAIVVQGRVLERAALKPVPGATVILAGHPELKTLTGSDGTFKITYGTSAIRPTIRPAIRAAVETRKSRDPETDRPWFRWDRGLRDAAGRFGADQPTSHAGYPGREAPLSDGESPADGGIPASAKTAAQGTLDVTCAGLAPKSVAVSEGPQNLGDIVLDYPPRRLDIGAPPVYGSIVLFDGLRATLDAEWRHWMGTYRKTNGLAPTPITWLFVKDPVDTGMTMETCCRIQWGDEDLITKRVFRDFQAHIEFNLVSAPRVGGGNPGPANSGVYLQSLYEIQIKDDYGVDSLGNHDAGGILNEVAAPRNEARPRGQWQAYDITFRAARFQNGVRSEKARVTLYWNGKLVHLDKETANEHAVGVSSDSLTDTPKGLKLQSEGHDVRFRNVWLKELDLKAPSTNVGY